MRKSVNLTLLDKAGLCVASAGIGLAAGGAGRMIYDLAYHVTNGVTYQSYDALAMGAAISIIGSGITFGTVNLLGYRSNRRMKRDSEENRVNRA